MSAPLTAEDILISDEQFNTHLNACTVALVNQLQNDDFTVYVPLLQLHCLKFSEDENGEQIGSEVAIMLLADFDAAQPVEYLRRVGRLAAQRNLNVVAAFLFGEAWVSVQAGPGEKYARPESDPDRQEAILISGMTLDLRPNLARVAIHRDKQNHLRPGKVTTYPYTTNTERATHGEIRNPQLRAFFFGFQQTIAEAVLNR